MTKIDIEAEIVDLIVNSIDVAKNTSDQQEGTNPLLRIYCPYNEETKYELRKLLQEHHDATF